MADLIKKHEDLDKHLHRWQCPSILLYTRLTDFAQILSFFVFSVDPPSRPFSCCRVQQGGPEHSDKGKGGSKKSMALQALNKNVFIWAGFFSMSLFVYSFLSGGDFSFLMTYGAMSRMFGFGILNVKTFKSKRATGVSVKTLQLYCLVFFFRLTSIIRHEGYLPYDKSGTWRSGKQWSQRRC